MFPRGLLQSTKWFQHLLAIILHVRLILLHRFTLWSDHLSWILSGSSCYRCLLSFLSTQKRAQTLKSSCFISWIKDKRLRPQVWDWREMFLCTCVAWFVKTHQKALPLSTGSSNDSLSAQSETGVWPARPRGVLRPQHRHLPLRHPHREDVQGSPGEDGRQNQVLEETLVRFRPSQAELLLLRGWGCATLTACLSVRLNSSSS